MLYSKIEGAEYCVLKKGDRLIKVGEKANYFYVIEEGSCHRLRYLDNGEEIILSRYREGNIACGFLAYYSMVAMSEIVVGHHCCCWKIPRESFLNEMDCNSKLMKIFLEQVLQDYFDMNLRVHSKSEGRTPNMLCHFLLGRARRNKEKQLVVDKRYSNVLLAKQMGVHRVTVTRIINVLKKEGILERTKEGLLIKDIDLLNEYAMKNKYMKY